MFRHESVTGTRTQTQNNIMFLCNMFLFQVPQGLREGTLDVPALDLHQEQERGDQRKGT